MNFAVEAEATAQLEAGPAQFRVVECTGGVTFADQVLTENSQQYFETGRKILEKMKVPIDSSTVSPFNNYLESLNEKHVGELVHSIQGNLSHIYCNKFPSKNSSDLNHDDWLQFDQCVKKFGVSDEYQCMVSNYLPPHCNKTLTASLILIQARIIFKENQLKNIAPVKPPMPSLNTVSNDKKVRYIGGYCVHKQRKHLFSTMQVNMESKKYRGQAFQRNIPIKLKLDLLNHITTTQENLNNTSKFKDSLSDQSAGDYTALIQITDEAFQFFKRLESIKTAAQVTFSGHGFATPQIIAKETLDNRELYHLWVTLFTDYKIKFQEHDIFQMGEFANNIAESASAIFQLYTDIVESYLTVYQKEYVQRLEQELGQKKSLEHRENILISTKKCQSTSLNIALKDIKQDESENKVISHMKLRLLSLENKTYFEKFKKEELLDLCTYYNICDQCKYQRKSDIINKITNIISTSSSMPNVDGSKDRNVEARSYDEQCWDSQMDGNVVNEHNPPNVMNEVSCPSDSAINQMCSTTPAKVTETRDVVKRSGPFVLDDILKDTSPGKINSHNKLQLMCENKPLFESFTCQQLLIIGRYYNLQMKIQQKIKLINQLVTTISSSDTMLNPPEETQIPQKSTKPRKTAKSVDFDKVSLGSQITVGSRRSERKRTIKVFDSLGYTAPNNSKSKKAKTTTCASTEPVETAEQQELYFCKGCGELYQVPDPLGIDWIGCDGCDQWYHYTCASLTWEQYQTAKLQSKWFCKTTCQNK